MDSILILFSYCNCEVGFETHFGKEKGHSSLFLSPHNRQLVSKFFCPCFLEEDVLQLLFLLIIQERTRDPYYICCAFLFSILCFKICGGLCDSFRIYKWVR